MATAKYRFTSGGRAYEFDLHTGLLTLENDEQVPLARKQWQLLQYLLENSGKLISKAELMDTVWDTVVGEETVTAAINALRVALHDKARDPLFIQTVHGRGYRFLVDVQAINVTEQTSINRSAKEIDAELDWTSKGVKIGLKYDLLRQSRDGIELSDKYIASLSDEASKALDTLSDTPVREAITRLQIVGAGEAKTGVMYVEELESFLEVFEKGPFLKCLADIGVSAKILADAFYLTDEFQIEFWETWRFEFGAINRELSRKDVTNKVVEILHGMCRARILLNAPKDHRWIPLLTIYFFLLFDFEKIAVDGYFVALGNNLGPYTS